MSRLISLLLLAVLVLGLVIALDPQARARAESMIQELELTLEKWNDKVIIDAPIVRPASDETPIPTPTPIATPAADNNDAEDSSDEPFIIINWDALGDTLRNLWESLNARINTDIK